MKCKILHESKSRLRIQVLKYRMTMDQADKLEFYLRSLPQVTKASVNERTKDAVIFFSHGRNELISALSHFDFEETSVTVPEHSGRALTREYEDKIFFVIAGRVITRFLFPAPLYTAYTVFRSAPYLRKGLQSLLKGKLDVPVLDAASIAVTLLTGDTATAGSVMFMMKITDLLGEWSMKKSVDELTQHMYFNVEKAWVKTADTEVLLPVHRIHPGDEVIVRTGTMIPLDGIVVSGEASVSQSTITGIADPVIKRAGAAAYAGSVVEAGECIIRVTSESGTGRYDRLQALITDSEKLKSASESHAIHMADRLVPLSFAATALTYLLTGSAARAIAILMVDYSCALELAVPISVMSAMRECSDHHINLKGGKFLEAASEASTVVFAKTGTLTCGTPRVAKIITFGGESENEMLRLAACLEEHFPHSIANAVVKEARFRNLKHEEEHTKVEYTAAHGIASSIRDQRVCIGSHHYILEDEKCQIPETDRQRYREIPNDYSKLFMAIDGRLKAVFCIEDPIRPEFAEVVLQLHNLGIDKVVLMTGDGWRTAAAVAANAGIDAYIGDALPEDKAAFIRREHEKGRKVIMVGDSISDSPALAEADAGIAVAGGTAIARDTADIVITAESLNEIVVLKQLADALKQRIDDTYRQIMTFNTGLIALGALGILPPASTALFHNGSTIFFGLRSMTDLLPEKP